MRRREVLAVLGALGASSVAGCTAGGDGDSSDGDPDDHSSARSPTGTGTATPTTTRRTPTATARETPATADGPGSGTGTDSKLTVPDGSEADRWRDVDYGGDHEPPSPPSTFSAAVVRTVAAEAEEAYLYDRLESASGLRNYGVAGYTVDPGAYVADRAPEAVLVRVRLGYSYECDSAVADAVSKATYRITTRDVVRVAGTTVDPVC